MPQIKLLVASCSRLVTQGLRETLAGEEDFIISRETSTIEEAILQAKGKHLEIILVCHQLLLAAGKEAVDRILNELNRARIVIFNSGFNFEEELQLIKAGALEVLGCECPPEDLVRALRRVHAGPLPREGGGQFYK